MANKVRILIVFNILMVIFCLIMGIFAHGGYKILQFTCCFVNMALAFINLNTLDHLES